MSEVFASFAAAMGAGLMTVYGLLVLLFGSFLQPITILISLPLSIGGAIIALLITHKAMSMPVVIGILMLMGIVTKNAIMLVDFAVEEIGRGTPRTQALVEAGRKRARPIVMTTIAMAAGMFPSALGLGDGGGFRSPMAIAVIGGLIMSTMLSLVFVPAVFTVLDDVGRFAWRRFSRFVGEADETPLPARHPKPARPERGGWRKTRSCRPNRARRAPPHAAFMRTGAEREFVARRLPVLSSGSFEQAARDTSNSNRAAILVKPLPAPSHEQYTWRYTT